MGVSSSFMLADARPAPQAVPSIRNLSPRASPAVKAHSNPNHPSIDRRSVFQPMEDDDLAREPGPSADAPRRAGAVLAIFPMMSVKAELSVPSTCGWLL